MIFRYVKAKSNVMVDKWHRKVSRIPDVLKHPDGNIECFGYPCFCRYPVTGVPSGAENICAEKNKESCRLLHHLHYGRYWILRLCVEFEFKPDSSDCYTRKYLVKPLSELQIMSAM